MKYDVDEESKFVNETFLTTTELLEKKISDKTN